MGSRQAWTRCAAAFALLAAFPFAAGSAPEGATTARAATQTAGLAAYVAESVTALDEHLILPPRQETVAGVVLAPRHVQRRPQRVAERTLYEVSATGSNGIPEAALRAYRRAESVLATDDPSCHLPWTLLAAVGRVESDHGRYGGSVLASDGVSRPAIVGPRLDGAGPFAAIPDSDGGAFDGDRVWDRAVGAMQFLPGTWRSMASDGDGNGTTDPNDLDDAALGAARYLCLGAADVAGPAGMAAALYRYNPSDYYVLLVMSYERGYSTGVFAQPSPPPPDEPAPSPTPEPEPEPAPSGTQGPTPTATPGPSGTPTGTPSPTPSGTPSGTPSPAPSGTPSGGPGDGPTTSPSPTPTPVTLRGTWTICGVGAWCLEGRTTEVGDPADLDRPAAADLDQDDTVETLRQELDGLDGRAVELEVEEDVEPLRVLSIDGMALAAG